MFTNKAKLSMFILIVCLLSAFFSETLFAANTAPPEVTQAAVEGMAKFSEAIRHDDVRHYGFSDESEITQLTLGRPFRIYTINPDRIINYNQETKLTSLITATNQWIFPVYSLGKVRSLITVDLMDGRWEAIAFGSAGLAGQLDMLEKSLLLPQDDSNKFVRIYQAKSDFLVLSGEAEDTMVPLTSAAVSLQLNQGGGEGVDTYTLLEILPRLIPIVEENLKSFD